MDLRWVDPYDSPETIILYVVVCEASGHFKRMWWEGGITIIISDFI